MNLLAQPLTLPSGHVIPNRIAKSAMSEVLGDPETGAPTPLLDRLYTRWGKSGAGLLFSGHVIVHPDGRGEPGNVVVTDDRHLPALRSWAAAAQAGGAQLWMQINHAGRQAPRRLTRQPVAPSPIGVRGFAGGFATPRALTDREIRGLVDRYAIAAAVGQAAGFAGVQIHGAHGYLVSQFLSPRTNQRDDEWGGDPVRRRRFLLAIVDAIRAAVGPRYPIGVKLNSADFQRGGFTVEESMDVARALEAAGIDLLEISGGSFESPAMAGRGELRKRASTAAREAYFLEYAQQIRTVTKVPLMLTGGLRTRATMESVLASGAVDVIGMARPMTHAPELPAQLLAGTADAAPEPDVRSRIRMFDDALQVFWFQEQIHRMGRGLDPDPKLSRFGALWRGIRTLMSPIGRAPALPAVVEVTA